MSKESPIEVTRYRSAASEIAAVELPTMGDDIRDRFLSLAAACTEHDTLAIHDSERRVVWCAVVEFIEKGALGIVSWGMSGPVNQEDAERFIAALCEHEVTSARMH